MYGLVRDQRQHDRTVTRSIAIGGAMLALGLAAACLPVDLEGTEIRLAGEVPHLVVIAVLLAAVLAARVSSIQDVEDDPRLRLTLR
jgi:hypothetical protein